MRWLVFDRLRRAVGAHDFPGLRGLLEGFNYYDRDRVKEVGPDRAAAEWIVRCEGKVTLDKFAEPFVDYNELIRKTAELDPRKPTDQVHVVSIDASDSSVTGFGCRHFAGLHHLVDVRFIRCKNLHDHGFDYMGDAVGTTLRYLQIESCPKITELGLEHLKKFSGLRSLLLIDLCRVYNKPQVLSALRETLPKCDIQFPDAQFSK